MSTPPGDTTAFSAGVEAQGSAAQAGAAVKSKASAAASSAASLDPILLPALPIRRPPPTFACDSPRAAGRPAQGGGRLGEPVTVTFVRLSALSCLYWVTTLSLTLPERSTFTSRPFAS